MKCLFTFLRSVGNIVKAFNLLDITHNIFADILEHLKVIAVYINRQTGGHEC